MKRLSEKENEISVSELLSKCETCIEGKQTKLPHNKTRKRVTRPLQLIHSDVFGPVSPTSYDKKRYVVTFIDDCTHFTVAYAMEAKSETFHYFKVFEAMATAHFGTKICRFRCDNGGEYISTEMQKHFESNGIQFEFTIRYTPQQNGLAERMNRTILEKARCMLLDSKVNKTLWTEAVRTAVYLINRSPTSVLDCKVPAYLWYSEDPNYKKLKVFGCIAYLKIPKELIAGKLDSRTEKCLMMGYCVNGYRLWSIEKNKIVLGTDVKFNETKFEYDSLDTEYWLLNNSLNEESHENLEMPKESVMMNEKQEDCEPEANDERVSGNEADQGSHPELVLRRSSREKARPKYLEDYAALAFNAETYVGDVPETMEDIQKNENKDEWLKAVNSELNSLDENNTWTLVDAPPNVKLINCKWIFKLKRDSNGNVSRYKARLVCKGCAQVKGYDYDETYAPVARLTTLRILLSIIVEDELFAYQLDVENAFLHGELHETIYKKVPPGVKENGNQVCKLNKTLYGLKQAPREWNFTFDTYVNSLNFVQSDADKCLYIGKDENVGIFLLLYVDDIILAGKDNEKIKTIKEKLKSRFRMKDMGRLSTFLGIDIKPTSNGMFLSQSNYLIQLLNRFKMSDCNPIKTPIETKNDIENASDSLTNEPYKELIGCLLYVTQTTRPDLSYAINYFSRFQSDPKVVHWKGLKRILRYVRGTVSLGLHFCRNGTSMLTGYADADWGSGSDRKSTSGYIFQLNNNLVCWGTKRQTTVAQSSTEAEYVALAHAATEFLWLKKLLLNFKITCEPFVMFEDNQSCIKLLTKYEHKRLKHIDIKYNFLKDLVDNKLMSIKYVSTENQLADIMTKGLSGERFVKLRLKIGVSLLNCDDSKE